MIRFLFDAAVDQAAHRGRWCIKRLAHQPKELSPSMILRVTAQLDGGGSDFRKRHNIGR